MRPWIAHFFSSISITSLLSSMCFSTRSVRSSEPSVISTSGTYELIRVLLPFRWPGNPNTRSGVEVDALAVRVDVEVLVSEEPDDRLNELARRVHGEARRCRDCANHRNHG